jgi:hypothetical protein
MDPTLQFLLDRRRRHLAVRGVQDWAEGLLGAGVESEAAARLAADGDLHWQVEEALIAQCLADLSRTAWSEDAALFAAYERESLADYLAGRIDGWTLILRGCKLHYLVQPANSYSEEYAFWIGLAEDADRHGGQGLGSFVGRPFDEALREALANAGLIAKEP